jgi:NADH-quinone oxidoreductase subunit B
MEAPPYDKTRFMNAEKEMSRLVEASLQKYESKPNLMFASLSEATKAISKGLVKWSREKSLWPLQFGLSCCAMELMDFGSARMDAERKGYLFFRSTPRQSDVMVIAGWVTKSMVPEIKRLYEQMLSPKYVIAYGECATCGGPWWESYNIVKGIDQVLPVDVYVVGCPPKPENLIAGFIKLQKKIGGEIED